MIKELTHPSGKTGSLLLIVKMPGLTERRPGRKLLCKLYGKSLDQTRIINGYQIQGEMVTRRANFGNFTCLPQAAAGSGKGRKYQEK